MFEFNLREFRGFHELTSARIAPITILIGENSAGKSSFLAGLSYLYELFSQGIEPSFNRNPFQLGTFQQIAHHRGGRAGRARYFTLGMAKSLVMGKTLHEVEVELTFSDVDSQAQIIKIEFKVDRQSLILEAQDEELLVSAIDKNGNRFPIQKLDGLSRLPGVNFAVSWRFVIAEIRYRLRRGLDQDEEDLFGKAPAAIVTHVANVMEHLSREFRLNVILTSPIRTRPSRTYTPGQEKEDGEGSHVPYELAKLARKKNREWQRIKSEIEHFGDMSDMFAELHIKSFGQNVSDPFQIQMSSNGPRTNLVDLGYGASQVLPIIYLTAAERGNSVFLIQQPEVHLHPKAQSALGEYFVQCVMRGRKAFVLETHSDFIVDRVRAGVRQGKLKASDVSILFFERQRLENVISEIKIDEEGNIVEAPSEYRKFFVDEEMYVLGLD